MGKDVVIALSAFIVILSAALAIASSRLVWGNWEMFKAWRKQDREMRIIMSLWMSVPVLMIALFWSRSVAIWNYIDIDSCCATLAIAQMLIYLPPTIAALGGMFWWACDRTFNPGKTIEGAGVADRITKRVLWSGVAISLTSFALTQYF